MIFSTTIPVVQQYHVRCECSLVAFATVKIHSETLIECQLFFTLRLCQSEAIHQSKIAIHGLIRILSVELPNYYSHRAQRPRGTSKSLVISWLWLLLSYCL